MTNRLYSSCSSVRSSDGSVIAEHGVEGPGDVGVAVICGVLVEQRGGGEGHGPVPGVGPGFADHPSAADASDRALEEQPAAGQDVRPVLSCGLTEPQTAEGEDEHQSAVALGPPVPSQLWRIHKLREI